MPIARERPNPALHNHSHYHQMVMIRVETYFWRADGQHYGGQHRATAAGKGSCEVGHAGLADLFRRAPVFAH
jgi:hypothetical protein